MHTLADLDALGRTLALPLWGRAAWARHRGRPDAAAEALLATLAVDTDALARTLGRWGWLVFGARAAWLEARVGAWLQAHPGGTLLNLGAGLDDLLHRVDEGTVRGLTVDRAGVIALRRARLPAHPREALVAATLPDEAAFADVAGPCAVVLAGVWMYLAPAVREATLRALGRRLAPGSLVLLDAYGAVGATLTNGLIRATGLTDEPVTPGGLDVPGWRRALGRPGVDRLAPLLADAPLQGLGAGVRALAAFDRAVGFNQRVELEVAA